MADRQGGPADIAIVGIGAMFPGRGDTLGFWRDIVEGIDCLGPVPETHWLPEDYYDSDARKPDHTYGRRGGFLSPKGFDPIAFGMPPNQIQATDTVQLLSLMVAEQALSEAETATSGTIDRERASVILGVASATELVGHMSGRLQRPAWVKGMREAGLPESQVQAIADRISENFSEWKESTFPGLLGNVVAGRIANRMNLGGANYVTDAACASSLSAVQSAIHELQCGDSDLVLAGGADALNDIFMYMCFSKTPALSPSEDCRPFSDKADGTMLGEGVGILALRRLEDAERDGNRIHAVIKGLGASSDGRGTAIYAPLPEGQSRALKRAYEQAGYAPETVELVEAHGTGTKAGDAAEIKGLKLVFDPDGTADRAWCAVGSVKSQIGHTKAAAGSASLIKAVSALKRRVLPPTIKVEAPAPALAGSPFYANRTARPWVRSADHPRRASVSSFGFGGSNFHATVEEYRGTCRAPAPRVLPAELVMLSAGDATALATKLEELARGLVHDEDLAIAASASHTGFDPAAAARLSLVASDIADFSAKASKLVSLLRSGQTASAPLPKYVRLSLSPARPGKLAFLMPGQGSQYVGMGQDLALAFPEALSAWDEAASHAMTGPQRLHDLAFPSPAFTEEEAQAQSETLTAMQNAQPALAAASLAVLRVLRKAGLAPDMAAGHSFGEVMALHLAGAFPAERALTLAHERARVMAAAAASAEGAMLATRADISALAPFLERHGEVVLANDNAPTQTVLSGPVAAIEAIKTDLEASGIKASRLRVASAFHSPIVSSAIEPFDDVLAAEAFAPLALPVYANTTAAPYEATPDTQRTLLSGQIGAPVRLRETIEAMVAEGVTTFIEAGPNTVLTALVGQIAPQANAVALDTKSGCGLSAFLSGLGELAVLGHAVDFVALFANMPAPSPRAPRSKHAIEINGANHAKPYPPKGGASALPQPNPETATPAANPPPAAAKPALPSPTVSVPSAAPSRSHGEKPMTDHKPAPASAIERIQAEMAARHGEYLNALSAAHIQFMQTSAALAGGGAQDVEAQQPAALPQVSFAPQARPEPQASAPAISAPTAAPAPASPAPAPAPVETPAAAPTASTDHAALVRSLVAEKTGYPEDMLEADMDLEGELGVDSIKQVEILSALREAMPDLPEIAPEQVAELRTIGKISAFISGGAPAPAPAAPPPSNGHANGAMNGHANSATNGHTAPSNGAANGDMASLVRGLIAEKTGYPEDMLEEDMDLEGELGVDSIKQVEILSALREARPDLPEIAPEQVAELRSIRKIADFFG